MRSSGTVHAHVLSTAYSEPIVKMPDRITLRRIFDLAGPWVFLVAAGAGLAYAITIATTLRDLRALEPVTLPGPPDPEAWRCQASATASSGSAEGEQTLNGAGAPQHQAPAERSASCPPGARQVRPQ
jgi:hypothetical protein